MKPFLSLKSVDEVLDLIFNLTPLGAETVSLENAINRRIFTNFQAPCDLPGFTRSTMDGYAVIASDVFGASESSPAFLKIAGNCPVGVRPDFNLNPGEAASIVTGAPLPSNADAVVMVEDTRKAGVSHIEIIRSVAPGANIVEADEDAAKGQPVIPKGQQIRAQEIGILAAFGIQEVAVFKKPAVAIISTGDEVVAIEEDLPPCKVRDVNSYSLEAFCKIHNANAERLGIIPDNKELLNMKLRAALEQADMVVVSGGSSAGMRDHTAEAFLSLPDASLLVHGVAMRPGKPFILALSGTKCLLGLPGHVTGALVCAHVFLAPIISRLQGEIKSALQPWIDATLARSIASAQGRRDYIRCALEEKEGEFIAQPLTGPSAVLSSLLVASGFVVCPENSEGIPKGKKVKFYPFQ